MRTILFAFLLLATDFKSELESLTKAERAFSELSVKQGTREAFLANLSNVSIIFRPRAVNGRQWFESNPARPGQLSWQPEFADISHAGDLGYTSGPFKFQREKVNNADPAVAVGHYVTIWRKETDGRWKVALDTGISGDLQQHQRLSNPVPVTSPRVKGDLQKSPSEEEVRAARSALIDGDRRFPTVSQDYAKEFAADARLYRDGSLPFINPRDIQKTLALQQGSFVWRLGETEMSRSADLGYAYGVVDFKPTDASKAAKTYNYLRIWKRERGKSWKVVLDLLTEP
jgi:ketosteroid isomerase-like protein